MIDNSYGARTVAKWVESRPEKSIWTGLKIKGRANTPPWPGGADAVAFLENCAPGG